MLFGVGSRTRVSHSDYGGRVEEALERAPSESAGSVLA